MKSHKATVSCTIPIFPVNAKNRASIYQLPIYSITNCFSVSYYFNVAACGGHFDDLVLIVNP
jgi:hypothetical protein